MTRKPAQRVHFKAILVYLALGLPSGHEVIAKEYDKEQMQKSNMTKKVETKMEHSAMNKTHIHRQGAEKTGDAKTSNKEEWTAEELECPNSGVLHRQCTFKCHKISEMDHSRICSTITDVKRCSCNGKKMEIKNKIVYDLETGNNLTETSGFESISDLCKSCVETCKKVPDNHKKKLKSGWKKMSFHCSNESQIFNQSSSSNSTPLVSNPTTMTTPEVKSDYSEEETEEEEETSEEYSGESGGNSEDKSNSTANNATKFEYESEEKSSEETEETEEQSSEEFVSEQYSASSEAVKANGDNLDVSYSEDTLEDYANPSSKDKALFSERVISRPNPEDEYYDPYLYNVYDNMGDLVRDRRSTDDSLQELTYYNNAQDLGQMLVEEYPPQMPVEYQENIEKLGMDERFPNQERVVHRPKPKNSHKHHSEDQKVTLGPSNDYENYIETPETNETTTSNDISTTGVPNVTSSINKHKGSVRASQMNQTNVGTEMDQELGNDLENKLLVETQFHPPTIDRSKACSPKGNETRKCTEDCAQDGKTCVMKVELNRCTCSGFHVVLTEIQKWDMARNEDIFLSTPDGQNYGKGYVRECGSCVEYCRDWPGEIKTHEVNTVGLSCKEVAESFDDQESED